MDNQFTFCFFIHERALNRHSHQQLLRRSLDEIFHRFQSLQVRFSGYTFNLISNRSNLHREGLMSIRLCYFSFIKFTLQVSLSALPSSSYSLKVLSAPAKILRKNSWGNAIPLAIFSASKGIIAPALAKTGISAPLYNITDTKHCFEVFTEKKSYQSPAGSQTTCRARRVSDQSYG